MLLSLCFDYNGKLGFSITCQSLLCQQYDEAREFVERARKCLATELAALVSF